MPANDTTHILRGIVLALVGATCWGFSATCAGYLMRSFGIEVTWLAFARVIISGPAFLLFVLATDRRRLAALLRDRKSLAEIVAFALIGVVMLQISYMSAVKYAGAGTALLLQETGLIVIMVIACLRARRRPTKTEIAALVLALVGVGLIATQGNVGSLGINPLGLAWGLVTGLALAGHNVIPTRLLDKYGSFIVNGAAMTLSVFLLAPIAQPWSVQVEMPLEGWAAFAAVVVIGTIFAYVVYLQGIKEAGPVRASLVAVAEPVSGMFFSAIWLGDAVTAFDLLGCAAIVAMMVLVTREGR